MSAFHRTFEVRFWDRAKWFSKDKKDHWQYVYIYGKQPPARSPSICDLRLGLNDGICDARLPDSRMQNTQSIVCTRQYPVITGVLKIGCESRVTWNFELVYSMLTLITMIIIVHISPFRSQTVPCNFRQWLAIGYTYLRTYACTDCTGRVGETINRKGGVSQACLGKSSSFIYDIHNMVNWQLSKQDSHWPVSHDHIADSCVNSSRWRDLFGSCPLTS